MSLIVAAVLVAIVLLPIIRALAFLYYESENEDNSEERTND